MRLRWEALVLTEGAGGFEPVRVPAAQLDVVVRGPPAGHVVIRRQGHGHPEPAPLRFDGGDLAFTLPDPGLQRRRLLLQLTDLGGDRLAPVVTIVAPCALEAAPQPPDLRPDLRPELLLLGPPLLHLVTKTTHLRVQLDETIDIDLDPLVPCSALETIRIGAQMLEIDHGEDGTRTPSSVRYLGGAAHRSLSWTIRQ